ncbi:MAG: malate dehydrogenase [Candidatus Fischerbacteria bacterium RBG_13_37_8]|uniref:Malate dehydrogenase n=1 Tax=Candidatus Fischerbacteria bacterium RBG_13_37_8 TaxID=1817863 RepID=A0A1F5VN75_9BACT|nr:MAG: malate dehydrogenase [Candidatus Fischerbacteria bacterium RBG_13_37_8]
MRPKITVIGAGHVGETTAHLLALKNLGDIVITDIIEDMPKGKALDMLEAGPVSGYDSFIQGTNTYEDIKGSHIVILTAGVPRKPGMSRDDLLNVNLAIVKDVAINLKKYAPDAMLIVITNPLDAMTYAAWKLTGLPKNKVFGMAGVLDVARYRAFISMELKVSIENTSAIILGGHGDDMVPLARYTTVAGIPVTEFISQERLNQIIDRTRKGGGEIVSLLKTGSAYYAPSASVVDMVDAILKDKKKIVPCCALLEGEYGVNGLYLGVPAVLGSSGVEKVIELKLTEDEQKMFDKSIASVKTLVDIMKL